MVILQRIDSRFHSPVCGEHPCADLDAGPPLGAARVRVHVLPQRAVDRAVGLEVVGEDELGA